MQVFLPLRGVSTVRIADHVVVLDGGSVVEQGSHEALMNQQGLYAQLVEMQAGRYRYVLPGS